MTSMFHVLSARHHAVSGSDNPKVFFYVSARRRHDLRFLPTSSFHPPGFACAVARDAVFSIRYLKLTYCTSAVIRTDTISLGLFLR